MPKVTRTPESEKIGAQLRELRLATTVSLNQAAKFLDQSRQSYVLYETGQPVSIDRFLQILALFDISPAEFFETPEMRDLLTNLKVEAAMYRGGLCDNTKHRSTALKMAAARGSSDTHAAG